MPKFTCKKVSKIIVDGYRKMACDLDGCGAYLIPTYKNGMVHKFFYYLISDWLVYLMPK